MSNNKNELSMFKQTAFGKFLKLYGGLIIVIIAMCALTSIFNPMFLKTGNILQMLTNNNSIFLAGLGMTFVIISGGIDLSQGAVAAFSSVLLGMLMKYGVNGWIALLI